MSTPVLPRFRTDRDARRWVAAHRAELVIDEATARRFERRLDRRKRVAKATVATAAALTLLAEAVVLVAGIAFLVILAAGLPR